MKLHSLGVLAAGALALCCTNAGELASYLGSWSNGRGETLEITAKTLQFGTDQPVGYEDITGQKSAGQFELQLIGKAKFGAVAGHNLSLTLAGNSLEVTGYSSHADLAQKKKSQAAITFSRDTPRGTQPETDPPHPR